MASEYEDNDHYIEIFLKAVDDFLGQSKNDRILRKRIFLYSQQDPVFVGKYGYFLSLFGDPRQIKIKCFLNEIIEKLPPYDPLDPEFQQISPLMRKIRPILDAGARIFSERPKFRSSKSFFHSPSK
eukprot:TRINITY_DN2111_c0_g1_i2.p1 TRINITY_DN2111_c0_g1~~TRINITY_DN2111_c0_g1_i2.p1  ORF type:complete len:126 (-),score=22.54 TRINITY_DN2111_c0_g1_i2:143-520(-)